MYMDENKISEKDWKRTRNAKKIIRICNQNIRMEFGIVKCALIKIYKRVK